MTVPWPGALNRLPMADQEVGPLQRRGLAWECGSTQKGPEIGGFRGPAFLCDDYRYLLCDMA